MSDTPDLMEAIVALAKRRGRFSRPPRFTGINGFFDYGPLGTGVSKKNIRDCWWNDMVRRRDDIVGLESTIIMHPKVWRGLRPRGQASPIPWSTARCPSSATGPICLFLLAL